MKRPTSGFSLMELLVVLAILSAAAALVGPNMFKALDKAQMRSEQLAVNELFEKLSFRAFVTNRPLNVTLKENQIEYSFVDAPEKIGSLEVQHLAFPEQAFSFSSVGHASVESITVKFKDELHSMEVLKAGQ